MNAGHIKISTRLDNSQIENDFQQLKNAISQHGGEAEERLNNNLNKMITDFDRLALKLREQEDLIIRFKKQVAEGDWSLSTSMALDKAETEADRLRVQMERVAIEARHMTNSLNEASPATERVRKGINLNIKSLLRYAGYLVGIRAVYSGIMKAVNSWYRDTEAGAKVQRQLQGVWVAFGQTLAPIITYLVGLLRTMLGYVNAITKGLFGFALFSKVASKNLGGAVNKAKELRKQLAGFDEMNILQEDGSTASGGGGGGIAPDLDLPEPDLAWMERIKPIIDDLIHMFGLLWENIKKVAGLLWGYFKVGLEVIGDLLSKTDIDIADLILTLMILYGAFVLFDTLATASTLGKIVIAIGLLIIAIGWLRENWDMIMGVFEKGFGRLREWFDGLPSWVKAPFLIIGSILEVFWNGLKGWGSGVMQVFKGITQFIAGVFTGDWKKAWEGVRNIFSGIWQSLTSLAKIPLNLIITAINVFLRGLNKIKIPSWVPVVGGKGFNIPQIPKLAHGAVVTKPTTALVGEAGREAVIPLQNNTGWAHEFLDVLDQHGGMGGTIHLTNITQIDGKEVARVTRKLNQDEVFRTNGVMKYGY